MNRIELLDRQQARLIKLASHGPRENRAECLRQFRKASDERRELVLQLPPREAALHLHEKNWRLEFCAGVLQRIHEMEQETNDHA